MYIFFFNKNKIENRKFDKIYKNYFTLHIYYIYKNVLRIIKINLFIPSFYKNQVIILRFSSFFRKEPIQHS